MIDVITFIMLINMTEIPIEVTETTITGAKIKTDMENPHHQKSMTGMIINRIQKMINIT